MAERTEGLGSEEEGLDVTSDGSAINLKKNTLDQLRRKSSDGPAEVFPRSRQEKDTGYQIPNEIKET